MFSDKEEELPSKPKAPPVKRKGATQMARELKVASKLYEEVTSYLETTGTFRTWGDDDLCGFVRTGKWLWVIGAKEGLTKEEVYDLARQVAEAHMVDARYIFGPNEIGSVLMVMEEGSRFLGDERIAKKLNGHRVVREYTRASDGAGEWVVREFNDGTEEVFWREKKKKKVRLVSVKHDMKSCGVKVVIEYDDGTVSKREVSEAEIFKAGGYGKWYAELERKVRLE